MNTCQMSDNSNRSAPSSPTGTIAATPTDQQAAGDQHPRLSRSRSLSDISQGDSPRDDQRHHQIRAEVQQVASDSLKVKIKTHTISTNDSNLSTPGGINNNNKKNNDKFNTKTNNSNHKVGKSKANKPINGGANKVTYDKTDNLNITLENNISKKEEAPSATANMMNNGGDILNAANGNSLTDQAQPSPQHQPPTTNQQQTPNQIRTSLSTELVPPTSTQSRQQVPLQTPPQITPTQSTPQPQQVSPKSEAKKPGTSQPTSADSKPKTTRARKSTAQSNKGANAQNATTTTPTTKPESKRTKKAKQNSESTQATKPAPVPSSQELTPNTSSRVSPPSTQSSKNAASTQQSPPVPSTKKRKPRAIAANSTPQAVKTTEAIPPAASPPKRSRKKKGEQAPTTTDSNNNPPTLTSTNIGIPPLNVGNPQLLSVASNVPMGSSPLISSAPLPPMHQSNINRQIPGLAPLDVHDPTNRYYSLTISPYASYDYSNTTSLTRPSLSRLFTSSASAEMSQSTNSHSDEIARAFEDLRDNTWSHLSKSILDQAQQFDIPSIIGTLYTLRSENDKLMNKVQDLTNKRNQLIAMNARLDLPGPMLTQHLNQTSPNFSSVVAGLTNSPKSLPNSSPSPAMNKSPIVSGGSFNHVPPINSLGPPSFIDRSSPLVGLQTSHSGVNSLKSSSISTPSPPTGALMAHGASSRASLMTVNNPPYMSNIHPSLNALNQLGGPTPPGSYYPRQ